MQRIISLGLLISSLFCYLEWADKSAFLFEAEYALFFGSNASAASFAHPFILLPLAGQLLLLFAVIKKQHNYRLIFTAMALISLLVLMILLVGILAANIKIIASTLPYLLIALFAIIAHRKSKNNRNEHFCPNSKTLQRSDLWW